MHSPWGIEFNIIKETGWTRQYLLWSESWINIQLMLRDAPSYKTKKRENKRVLTTKEELEDFFK
ncbi:MAG: hypothetical protein ACXVAY_01390 [Mucilaginibacter sp.]